MGEGNVLLLASRQESALLLMLNISLSPSGIVGTTKAVDRMAKKSTTQTLEVKIIKEISRCKEHAVMCLQVSSALQQLQYVNSSSVPSELVTLPYKHKIAGTT